MVFPYFYVTSHFIKGLPTIKSSFMKVLILTCIYVFFPILILYLYQRYIFLRKIGTIIMAYAVGILLSMSGVMDMDTENSESVAKLQNILQSLCIPLAIPLMLFSSNIKLWLKSLRQTFIAFFTGIFAIVVTVIIAYLVFRTENIAELNKAAGLMVGFYTGGTPNVASLNMALQPSPETFMLVNSFQIIVTFFFLVFIISGGYKLIRKVLPYGNRERQTDDMQISSESFEDYGGMLSQKSLKALVRPLSLSVFIFIIAAVFSLLFPKDYQIVAIVLVITSLAIAATFMKKIRNTPKTFELGMYFILIFSIIISSNFRLDRVNSDTVALLEFIIFIMIVGVSMHLLLAKIFKIEGDLYTIAISALLFSPPFVPTIAGSMNNKRVMISGIVIGLLGYAVGNYLGIGVAEFTKWIS